MAAPLDERGVLPRRVLEQGEPLPVGHDAVIRLIVGTDDAAVEDGGIERCEPERDQRIEGRVD